MTEPTPADRVLEATRRARALGWRTITVSRLARIAAGDEKAMPPDPATAPRSAFSTYRSRTP
ncbi:hypothetical protein OOK06_36740 [Streptomyces sp. NBC_00340]|uniref:hypothetical protein n=1 Tax=Streptomyces sp. NBC_00340 TaxID=2975716 RepID=UPI002254DF1E|nr:hypothetical protein [Streptomyces sp. NBC_00340]MCX5137619.1 hypothetical protein [Streptomyces sp. NBC_00340]